MRESERERRGARRRTPSRGGHREPERERGRDPEDTPSLGTYVCLPARVVAKGHDLPHA